MRAAFLALALLAGAAQAQVPVSPAASASYAQTQNVWKALEHQARTYSPRLGDRRSYIDTAFSKLSKDLKIADWIVKNRDEDWVDVRFRLEGETSYSEGSLRIKQ